MTKESKIHLFKDKKDYEKILTEDEVVNIIGSKGSGKTSSSIQYINNHDYIVINCDRLLELPGSTEEEDEELPKIRKMLKDKYNTIAEGQKFLNCYNDIVNYILSKNKKALIEGNIIQGIDPITLLKGKIIIKRTGVFKCFIRAVKRDYPNEHFMKIEIEKHGKFGKITRFLNIVKRRKKIFWQYKDIERKIKELERIQ